MEQTTGRHGERQGGRKRPAIRATKGPAQRNGLTHPDRLYWPDEGVTKQGLADYYTAMWPRIAPWIAGRPLSLLRAPSGITGKRFFQRHAWKGIDRHVIVIQDPMAPESRPLVAIDDLDGLRGLVQSAALEIHPWGSTLADWEHPDRLVMDLDPGEGAPWPALIEAARECRQRLESHGLAAFVKTSGSKGLHVVSPLAPRADWPAVKAFAKALADQMAADSPERFVSTISKAKRRGKILVDYLRNVRGATSIAAWCPRARPGAAISAPLRWDELDGIASSAQFTLLNIADRLAALKADPWDGFDEAAVPLTASRSV